MNLSQYSGPASREPGDLRWLAFVAKLDWRPGKLDDCTWRAARRAASLGVRPERVWEVVTGLIVRAGDTVKPAKVADQIRRAYAKQRVPVRICTPVHSQGSAPQAQTGPAKFRPELLAAVTAPYQTRVGADPRQFIISRSPRRPTDLTSNDVLRHLFYPGEKALIFTSMTSQGDVLWTHSLDEQALPAGTRDGVWLLANPVSGISYLTDRVPQTLSRRTHRSITSFRFAVLESDQADQSQWLTLLAILPLRLAAIYSSGRRSIHALVRVDAATKSEWDATVVPMKRSWAALGADPAALTAVRLTRLPQAWRGNNRQELLFLNPTPCNTPVVEMPARLPQ